MKATNSETPKCHTVLIVVRSLLDNEPYKHEPGKGDNPEFNAFVQYTTWKSLLLDYLEREAEPAAKSWLQKYVRQNGQDMLRDLARQHAANARRIQFSCPYKNVRVQADYPKLTRSLQALVSAFQPKPVEEMASRSSPLVMAPTPRENATLKRKCGPEAEDMPRSQARAQEQKHGMLREPEKKKRAKHIEVIDLT